MKALLRCVRLDGNRPGPVDYIETGRVYLDGTTPVGALDGTKLKNFNVLLELDLSNVTPIPLSELAGGGIKPQPKELKRLSPCALNNWIQVSHQSWLNICPSI